MCATVCRRTTGCGRTSTRGVGRAASTSPSSNKLKYTVLAALGGGVVWPMALFISLSSSLALAIVGLRGAERWLYSARAIATLSWLPVGACWLLVVAGCWLLLLLVVVAVAVVGCWLLLLLFLLWWLWWWLWCSLSTDRQFP